MNASAPSTNGFVARCSNCGAPQAIVIGAPIERCRHCGTLEPLAGRDRARVEEASALSSRVAVREHRRLLEHRGNVELIAFLTPLSAGLTWLLFGGLLVAMVSGDLPDEMSLIDLALLEHGAQDDGWGDELVTGHWTIFALLVGLAATLSTYLFALAKACAAVRPAAALPPLPGGPARCHLCGAALVSSGTVRRCLGCGGRNLVTNRALHAQVAEPRGARRFAAGAGADFSARRRIRTPCAR
jgi:DNA-directed RNA polymerase subunit RPC12/RpoP